MKPLMSADNYFGLPDLPFNLHLGLEFTRPQAGGPAVLRLPQRESNSASDGTTHRAAIYTVGEVAAAVAVLDELVDALPVFLLTLGGSFRQLAPARSEVSTRAYVEGAPEDAAAVLAAKRKLPFTAGVTLFDEDATPVAEMSVSFSARPLSKTLEAAFVAETPAR